MEDGANIGPFGHLRKGAHLGKNVHLGNFGEVKNSFLQEGAKMGHFSYIGDAQIGRNTNIGAGTITCNFDGEHKNKTEIGDDAFIGSDTMLVAPLKIGRGARTGAGAVVTHDIPADTLVVGVPARIHKKIEKERLMKISNDMRKKLIEEARLVRKWSYAPYSHYAVGAALLAESGKIYSGVNVENAAYPMGLC